MSGDESPGDDPREELTARGAVSRSIAMNWASGLSTATMRALSAPPPRHDIARKMLDPSPWFGAEPRRRDA